MKMMLNKGKNILKIQLVAGIYQKDSEIGEGTRKIFAIWSNVTGDDY
jgi:hypothetical protein